ncbi:hypothetical protein QBC35DRAFT_217328 [Podospora australis]|uniref:Uncharacterized protein n=1 Tax=Podospora australis TaxID=1536484 RepID=A0AAN6WTJ9_9PEZI|nr:hypothetical protein QBC35DRAFT_217328 [Podospora australis]
MLRLTRPRSFFGASRLISRVPSGQVVRVERVRLKSKKRFKFLATFVKLFLAVQVFDKCIAGPLVKFLKEDPEAIAAAKEQEEEDEDLGMFFPFPLTLKRHEPEPYSGKDPEWQEFIRMSKDKDLMIKIRKDTVDLVHQAVKKHSLLQMKYGRDIKVRRFWMDLDFPYRAPPTYTQAGLLWTADRIGIADDNMDSMTAKLIQRVLWPEPLALSTWSFVKALVQQNLAALSHSLGLNDSDDSKSITNHSLYPPTLPTTHTTDVQKTLDRLRQQATKRPEEVNDPAAMASRTQAAHGKPAPTASVEGGEGTARIPFEDKVLPFLGLSNRGPWDAFKKTYARTWKPLRADPPRGCVAVSGLVEIELEKAWLVVDVLAWYNPKTKAHDKHSFWMSIRRIQHKQQSPGR